MFKSKTILAFIGARAGSKGLKNKNIIDFAGKPLIHWTIQASLKSKYIDRTIVSTDGEQIARAAKASGAEVPFLRPKSMAQDKSPIYDAIRHALKWAKENEKIKYDYLLNLQPTSPLRTSRHIDQAIEYYFKNRRSDADTLVSGTKIPSKYGWLMHEDKKRYIHFCLQGKTRKGRRQELPDYYLPNGVIFLAPVKVIQSATFYTSRTLMFAMDEDVSVDIDAREDLVKALRILKAQKR